MLLSLKILQCLQNIFYLNFAMGQVTLYTNSLFLSLSLSLSLSNILAVKKIIYWAA
jgi:hypothetical protein